MGSELLKHPENIKDILTTLVKNVPKPITCKIRLLEKAQDTIDLVKMIESCGVSAIAVHARYVPQRPRQKAHLDLLPNIVSAVSIPVIANGDIFSHDLIEKTRDSTTASYVMVARGALYNCSIFSKQGEHVNRVAQKFIQNCLDYELVFGGCKYGLQRMFDIAPHTNEFKGIISSRKYSDLVELFDVKLKNGLIDVEINREEAVLDTLN
jgi:tRNA-dihydrouridine synthase 2